MFDNTTLGSVSNAFNYSEMLFDLNEGLGAIKRGKTTKENVIELLRRKLVGAARCGKKLVINIDKHVIDFKEEWTSTTKIFNADRTFDRALWKDSKEYHMQIVGKDENYDNMMNMGAYHMKDSFEIIICGRHVSDEQ